MRQLIITHMKQYLHFFNGHNAALTLFLMTGASLCSFLFSIRRLLNPSNPAPASHEAGSGLHSAYDTCGLLPIH